MIYKNIILIIFLFFCPYYNIFSQSFSVFGILKENFTNTSIQGATIKLKNDNDSTFTLSDTLGDFKFYNINLIKFKLLISHVEFEDTCIIFQRSSDDKYFNFGNIYLKRKQNYLKEVIVKSNLYAIKILDDTIEYKADSFKTRKYADIEDLLKRLPGIKVEKDGAIFSNGKVVTRIRVNGKDFFDGNNSTVTKNLPASIVDKVQVIEDYGEASNFTGFKTNNSTKVINIELKKNKGIGVFDKFQSGIGLYDKLNLNNSFNYFDSDNQVSVLVDKNNINGGNSLISQNKPFVGSLSGLVKKNNNLLENQGGVSSVNSLINNQDIGYLTTIPGFSNGVTENNNIGVRYSKSKFKNFNIYASYIYFNQHYYLNDTIIGKTFFSNYELANNQIYSKNSNISGNRAFLNLDFHLDSSFSIKLTPKYFTNNSSLNGKSYKYQYLNESLFSKGNSYNESYGNINEYSLDLLIKKKFLSNKSVFFWETIFNINNNLQKQITSNNYFYIQFDSLNQIFFKSLNNNILESKLVYALPFKRNVFTELYLDVKVQNGFQNVYTFHKMNSNYIFDSAYSGNMKYINHFSSFGSNIKFNVAHKEYVVGVGFQNNSNYRNIATNNFISYSHNLIPIIQIKVSPSKTQNFLFQYTSNLQTPDISFLQPLVDSGNSFIIYKGNLLLKPEFKNSASLTYYKFSYENGRLLLLNLSLNKTYNKIIQSVELTTTGKTLITYTNMNFNHDINFYYNYSIPFMNRKYEVTLSGNILSNQSAIYNNKLLSINNLLFNQTLQCSVNNNWIDMLFGATINKNEFMINNNFNSIIDYSIQNSTDFFINNFKCGYNFIHIKRGNYLFKNMKDLNILDIFFETTLKDKFIIKLEGKDILNQTFNNTFRTFSLNTMEDHRYNVIGRYFMLSFIIKINKFGKIL